MKKEVRISPLVRRAAKAVKRKLSDDELLPILLAFRGGDRSARARLAKGLEWLVWETFPGGYHFPQLSSRCNAVVGTCLDRLKTNKVTAVTKFCRDELVRTAIDYRDQESGTCRVPSSTKAKFEKALKNASPDKRERLELHRPRKLKQVPNEPRKRESWSNGGGLTDHAYEIPNDAHLYHRRSESPPSNRRDKQELKMTMINVKARVCANPFERQVFEILCSTLSHGDNIANAKTTHAKIAKQLGVKPIAVTNVIRRWQERGGELIAWSTFEEDVLFAKQRNHDNLEIALTLSVTRRDVNNACATMKKRAAVFGINLNW